jgi:hypothetical protein
MTDAVSPTGPGGGPEGMPKPKRAWPLFLLAGAAFLPGFGVLFGAAAVTWALVSDRPRALVAAGLGAAGALLNLIGGALLVWHAGKNPAYASAGAASARRDLSRLVGAIEAYHREQGRYPVRLATFTQLPYSLRLINIQDFSVGVFSRPREYRYDLAPDGRTYTLFAVGADGRPGTADDLFPELPDSVIGHSGYRSP